MGMQFGDGIGEELEDGGDGSQGGTFEAVVDVDVGPAGSGLLEAGEDHVDDDLACGGIGVLDLGIGLETFHGFGIAPTGAQEESGAEAFGMGTTSRSQPLLFDRRHGFPGIVHVNHPMAGEGVEVIRVEERAVPDLDPVIPAGGELTEETVEVGDEIASASVVAGMEVGELEHEQADLVAMDGAGGEESVPEEVGVEEVGVDLALTRAEPREFREVPQGDVVGDLEGKPESIGDLGGEAGEVFGRGEGVIGGIDADGAEGLGVFGEAIAFESGVAEFAAIQVTGFVVERADPPGIFPGGGADVDAASGQLMEESGDLRGMERGSGIRLDGHGSRMGLEKGLGRGIVNTRQPRRPKSTGPLLVLVGRSLSGTTEVTLAGRGKKSSPGFGSQAGPGGRDEEGVLFKEAAGAVPRKVLGQVDEEDVGEGDRDEGETAAPTECSVSGLGMSEGATDGPAGEDSGGEHEKDEQEGGQPLEFGRGQFDLEEVKGDGREDGHEQGDPEGEGSAGEQAADGPDLKQGPEPVFEGESGLEKGEVQGHRDEQCGTDEGEQRTALLRGELGGDAEQADRNGKPQQGSNESPRPQPEEAVEVQSANEREEIGAGAGKGFPVLEPAQETQRCGPEEVMESTAPADCPHPVDQGDADEGADQDPGQPGTRTSGSDQFGILPQTGSESDGKGDQGETEEQAPDPGGGTDPDEAITPASGSGDATAGVEQVAEAEEVEEGDDGEDGEAADQDGDTEEQVPGAEEPMQQPREARKAGRDLHGVRYGVGSVLKHSVLAVFLRDRMVVGNVSGGPDGNRSMGRTDA